MSEAPPPRLLPLLLSLNGGYVDTAGFLALQGLFTAHVTGNFVTFGASLALGTSGAAAKLLALPVFCVVVLLARLAGRALERTAAPVLRLMLAAQLVLLALGAVMAIALGPFTNGDAPAAMATGMVLVAGMAIQNAAHRRHLPSAPPSTLMTGTTTQVMLDLADMLAGDRGDAAARTRLGRMALSVASFALGCAAAALLFMAAGAWCFLLPPLLIAAALLFAAPA